MKEDGVVTGRVETHVDLACLLGKLGNGCGGMLCARQIAASLALMLMTGDNAKSSQKKYFANPLMLFGGTTI